MTSPLAMTLASTSWSRACFAFVFVKCLQTPNRKSKTGLIPSSFQNRTVSFPRSFLFQTPFCRYPKKHKKRVLILSFLSPGLENLLPILLNPALTPVQLSSSSSYNSGQHLPGLSCKNRSNLYMQNRSRYQNCTQSTPSNDSRSQSRMQFIKGRVKVYFNSRPYRRPLYRGFEVVGGVKGKRSGS
ncbi:uncharacterized protein LOC105783090 [Gossypium raimondii]|uniref:uncharacterized protein LOC105783090 n=1 Tax=Gossypium raimondii TaxID=29730 RepID=UPI00227BF06C|nr:uncharacterized protein LOC105783090 [Gossypium raimondii]